MPVSPCSLTSYKLVLGVVSVLCTFSSPRSLFKLCLDSSDWWFFYKVGREISVENKYFEPISRALKREVGLCFLAKEGISILSLSLPRSSWQGWLWFIMVRSWSWNGGDVVTVQFWKLRPRWKWKGSSSSASAQSQSGCGLFGYEAQNTLT